MRIHPLLATLLACAPCLAVAQSETPLELGVPSEIVFVDPSAFIAVGTDGANLLLRAHPGFLPVVQDYVRLAGPDGISVSICGRAFPPFQPTYRTAGGQLDIPLGDAATAEAAASVMAEETTCDSFPAAPDASDTSLLPPATAHSGLTITSPSDSYAVPASDILVASLAFNDTSGRHDMVFSFGTATAQWIATNTTAHIGGIIELSVCGEVINAPVVQEPIVSGSLIITGHVAKQDAEAELAQILGTRPCP